MARQGKRHKSSTLGMTLTTYRGHAGPVGAVAWSPDGRRLASGGGSPFSITTDHTVQVWDVASESCLVTYRGHTDSVLGLAWSPDGVRLASASTDRTMQMWDAASGRNLVTHGESRNAFLSLAWSPDGRFLAAAGFDGRVLGWDAETGKEAFTYFIGTWVTALAWSPDEMHLAVANDSCHVQVFALADAGDNAVQYRGHINEVWAVTWSPNGKYLASGSHISRENDLVQVWRFIPDAPYESGRVRFDPWHPEQAWATIWSQDGQQTMRTGKIRWRAWSAQAVGEQAIIYRGPSGGVRAIAWSPDSTRIVSGDYEGLITVWKATTGRTLFTYRGHSDLVSAVGWIARWPTHRLCQ